MKLKLLHATLCAYGRKLTSLSLITVGFTTLAFAHEGRGLNGGQLADSGSSHVEFIGGSGYDLLIFAISDKSQKPLSASGSAAFALMQRDGQKVRIPLVIEGENILASSNGPSPRKGESVWFVARLANGETLKAQFVSR